MLDIFKELVQWEKAGQQAAIATVIKTWGSAPRPIGSSMAIASNGEIIGSVSGGCVEGKVSEAALEVISTKQCQKLSFGVSDQEAWTVGLSCGGKIDVFIRPAYWMSHPSEWSQLKEHIASNQAICVISQLDTGNLFLSNSSGPINFEGNDRMQNFASSCLTERKSKLDDEAAHFAHLFPRKSQMIIIGAAHITVDLVSLAKSFGFETIVLDPRGFFVDNTLFETAPDACIQNWPAEVLGNYPLDQFTYAVTLSHDPKIDDQALDILLDSSIAYIGALGSKRTHAKRVQRLQESGRSMDEINRIHGPVGISINAKTPKEIALSVMAQIIEVKNKFI